MTGLAEKQHTQVNQKERWETLREIQRMKARAHVIHEPYEQTEFLNVWVDA